MIASRRSHSINLVKLLLDKGANREARNVMGETPFMIAIKMKGWTPVADLLKNYGRDQARYLVGLYYNGDLSVNITEEEIKSKIKEGGVPLLNEIKKVKKGDPTYILSKDSKTVIAGTPNSYEYQLDGSGEDMLKKLGVLDD